jgi:hypothetical protein
MVGSTAVFENIRQGWKWLFVTKANAYHAVIVFTSIKSFILQVPGSRMKKVLSKSEK